MKMTLVESICTAAIARRQITSRQLAKLHDLKAQGVSQWDERRIRIIEEAIQDNSISLLER